MTMQISDNAYQKTYKEEGFRQPPDNLDSALNVIKESAEINLKTPDADLLNFEQKETLKKIRQTVKQFSAIFRNNFATLLSETKRREPLLSDKILTYI